MCYLLIKNNCFKMSTGRLLGANATSDIWYSGFGRWCGLTFIAWNSQQKITWDNSRWRTVWQVSIEIKQMLYLFHKIKEKFPLYILLKRSIFIILLPGITCQQLILLSRFRFSSIKFGGKFKIGLIIWVTFNI